MGFQRARSEQQKQLRIDDIISITAEIFDREGFENLNLSAISEQAGFTRPAIYRYFSGVEEILLKVMLRDLESWSRDIVSAFESDRDYDVPEIANIWAQSIITRERMLKLYSIFNTILEKRQSVEAMIDFQKSSFLSMGPVKMTVNRLFPLATEEQIKGFLDVQMALALGLYQMSHISQAHREAAVLMNQTAMIPGFESIYVENLCILMRFLKQGAPLVS